MKEAPRMRGFLFYSVVSTKQPSMTLTLTGVLISNLACLSQSHGKVPGSKSVYEKQIDVNGKTIQATKTTYDPKGNIIHVKEKINGGTYP